jgi:hypothetical protein
VKLPTILPFWYRQSPRPQLPTRLAPLTPDLSAWYASTGLAAAAIVVALACFSFYSASAGRPLLAKGRLGDEA